MNTSDIKVIKSLLNEINATQWLRNNIDEILKRPKALGIFANQIINALKIGVEFKNGYLNIGNLAPMQSGKSGTIYFLCNYVLIDMGFLKECEHVLFVTSMTDTDLYDQNKVNLEQDPFDFVLDDRIPSRIMVFKIHKFFKSPNPYQIVQNSNIKLIVRDEDHYGAGETSVFDTGFFKALRIRLPRMPLLSVSATPFDILDAKEKGYDVAIVEGLRPDTYFGITEMLKGNFIQDLPPNFSVFEKLPKPGTGIKLHPIVEEYSNHLLSFDSGLGIVRVTSSIQAKSLRMIIRQTYRGLMECLFIGSNSSCDFSINQGIEEVKKLVITQKKKVFLIIVQALSAGKDFKNLKEEIRFGIETRQRQLANVAQGLPGRLCGYHSNRSFKLLASKALLTKYSEFEMDYNEFFNQTWRKGIFNRNILDLTTQSSLVQEVREGMKTVIDFFKNFSIAELNSATGKEEVIKNIGLDSYNRIMESFEPSIYRSETISNKFRLKDATGKSTIRLASAYNIKSNRVYKLWPRVTMDSDFGSIMFKKKDYAYGILISNYPVGHAKNTLGFCGIMIIKAGKKKMFSQKIVIDNGAMYVPVI